MKRYHLIYFIVPVLIIVFCTVALAESPIEWITTSEFAREADPEYQQYFDVASIPWLDSKESDGIVYFVFQSPARIERYDMNAETWLADISLGDTPTAFAVDADGLYISFGRRTSRFDLGGTGETHLHNTSSDATELFTINEFLYIYFSDTLVSVNKFSGTLISSKDYWYSMRGIDVAPTIGKAFARTTGVSPSDIVEVILNSDGTLGNQNDSPYHGDYPSAAKTFVFPGETRVADNSGIIYNSNDLTYSNSLAGSFDNLAFYGDLPIVLRDGTLIAYSNAFLETGRYTPDELPLEIYVKGEFIFSFFDGVQGTDVTKIPIGLLEPDEPGQPVDPNGLSYVPDSVLLGENEVVYLLSRSYLSIFRWSVSQRSYSETIPLSEAPTFMTYSGQPDRLYLAYPSGKITQIALDQTELSETPFANSPQTPCGLATAGEYLFACDPSGAWVSHFTYSPTGTLISQEDWNYRSDEYIWSEANRKMYFFRDDTSPNDLLWEDINENGVIGGRKDSPYHSSEGIVHPIRVAPDGSIVVLGSGRIYDAISLEQIDTLSNNIADAVWGDGDLFTLRAFEGATQVQKWDADYSIQATLRLDGTPIRVFPVSEGLLVITHLFNKPWFWILDLDLNIVYQSPIYQAFLPAVLCNNYCPDFFDDFSNPASGWTVGEDSYVRAEYLNGEYRVLSKQDGYLYLFGAPTCARENYTVEMDARWQGTPGSSYGLLFGLTGDFSYYYLFDVNTDYREFRLYRRSPSGLIQIVTPTYASAINGGTASNHLKVTRNGNQITLYANGTALGTWWDSGITGLGGVGLISSPYIGSPTSDARFDNFNVVKLTTGGAGAQSTGETNVVVCEPGSSHNYIEQIGNLEW